MRRARHVLVLLLLGAVINWAVAWGLMAGIDVHATSPRLMQWPGVEESLEAKLQTIARYVGAKVIDPRLSIVRRWDQAGRCRLIFDRGSNLYYREEIGTIESLDGFAPAWSLGVLQRWREFHQAPLPVDADQREWVRQQRDARSRLRVEAAGWPMLSVWGAIVELPPGWGIYLAKPVENCSPRYGAFIAPTAHLPGSVGNTDAAWTIVGAATPITILPWYPLVGGTLVNAVFYASVLWVLAFVPRMIRGRWRTRHGHCGACGYDLRGQAEGVACPECGAARRVVGSAFKVVGGPSRPD